MINHKGSFYLGVFVFLIPFLGFPTMWKMILVVVAGVILILTSIRIPIPRRILRAAKQKREDHLDENPKVSPIVSAPPPPPVIIINKETSESISKTPAVIKKVRRNSPKIDSVRKSNTQQ